MTDSVGGEGEGGRRRLCRDDEIAEGAGRGFTFGRMPDEVRVFVVRHGGRLHGYVNACPHVGATLDWTPDRFLTADGRFIQCQMHGALFDIADGRCVRGPCVDRYLSKAEVVSQGGVIYLLG